MKWLLTVFLTTRLPTAALLLQQHIPLHELA